MTLYLFHDVLTQGVPDTIHCPDITLRDFLCIYYITYIFIWGPVSALRASPRLPQFKLNRLTLYLFHAVLTPGVPDMVRCPDITLGDYFLYIVIELYIYIFIYFGVLYRL